MTIVTWILLIFGFITCAPLLVAQIVILLQPKGQKAKDILIGQGEEWRDNTHFRSAYALAITDWLVFTPFFVLSVCGVLIGAFWGYLFLAISGAIQLYINIFLSFFEKEYVYTANGPIKYYTYIWGNFVLWGAASLLYGMLRLSGSVF